MAEIGSRFVNLQSHSITNVLSQERLLGYLEFLQIKNKLRIIPQSSIFLLL